MKARELLKHEHPEMIAPTAIGGCVGCPCEYGYNVPGKCVNGDTNCKACWDQEVPRTVTYDDVRRKAKELVSDGKKAEVHAIITSYANAVSGIPEDKLAEMWQKLIALEAISQEEPTAPAEEPAPQPEEPKGFGPVVFIAGPITGVDEYWKAFESAEERLILRGFVPLSPATLPVGMTNAQYERICLAMIDCADAVLFLPGWERSRGATLEHHYCAHVGKPIAYRIEDLKGGRNA